MVKKFRGGDFALKNKDCERPKFEDGELQASLDEDDAQTQQQLAASLGVTRQAVLKRLQEIGKIQKEECQGRHQVTQRQ